MSLNIFTNSVEATVIIIAACLPTLRPVFLQVTSGTHTRNDRPTFSKRSGDLELNSRPNSGTIKGVSTDIYSTNVHRGAEADSMEDGILPPTSIRMTQDVYATRNEREKDIERPLWF